MNPVLELRGVSFSYKGAERPSLKDVDLAIVRGKKTVIMGANGAGKSTLFHHLNGILKPDRGTVLFDGQPVSYRRKGLRALRSKVSLVMQNPDDQIFGQTVEADAAYGPRNLGLPDNEVASRVEEALSLVGLSGMRKQSSLKLSYGQRKRLSLAGALAMRPEVLVMDEPTAGLDPQMASELMELAEQLHHSGTTVVISTHDVDLAYSWADVTHVLRGGEVVYSGDADGFYDDPVQVYLSGLMQPSMFAVNRSLCMIRGIPEAPCPKTESQMVAKVTDRPCGTLSLIPVSEDVDPERVAVMIEGCPSVGVYGAGARRFAGANSLRVDYYFDAFESCIGRCLGGEGSLLLVEDGYEDLVLSKVCSLEPFGRVPEVRRPNP